MIREESAQHIEFGVHVEHFVKDELGLVQGRMSRWKLEGHLLDSDAFAVRKDRDESAIG